MTIIKDLIVLNDDNFYLTKEDKIIKNEYNVIGKSYNKKEKYKTQETNYELSLEYILNKSDKAYFFNLLNDNNYFLYKTKESFLSDLVYVNNITTIYINTNDPIFNNINIFNYNLDNRLYLLINNKKYSFYFDESYDYNLNGKYRLVDEISNNVSSNLDNTNAELLDICILVNNSIKFKLLTDEKYNLTFDIETINNIITSLSINNTITPNLIDELSYNELYTLTKDVLFTKLLKLNSNHFMLINVYSLLNNTNNEYDLEENIYMYISYKKLYINDLHIIEQEEEFFSLVDFENKFRYKDFGEEHLYKRNIYNFIDFNVILDNNEIYFNFSSSLQDIFTNSYKVYDGVHFMLKYIKESFLNNILLNHIEYIKFEINDKKMNILDYKKQEIETLVDYKKYKEKDKTTSGSNIYQSNIETNMYIYNNLLYTSNFINTKIITNQYNKNNNELKQINNKEMHNSIKNNYNWFGQYVIKNDSKYNFYFRAKEDNIDYKIKNKSNFYNLDKNYATYYNNENNLIETEKLNYNLINYNNDNLMLKPALGLNGFGNSNYAINKVLESNNKRVFVYSPKGKNNNDFYNYSIFFFRDNVSFLKNNNEFIVSSGNISGGGGDIVDIRDIYLIPFSKFHIKYYYNNINNKHYFVLFEYKNVWETIHYDFHGSHIRIFEITLNETTNIFYITKGYKFEVDYFNEDSYIRDKYALDKKIFDFYFDEQDRKFYITTIFNAFSKIGTSNLESRQIICLNEDLTVNYKIEDLKDLTY